MIDAHAEDLCVATFENHGQDSRVRETDVSDTRSGKDGTGGNNLPLVVFQKAGHAVNAAAIMPSSIVRRLLPSECESLQAFPRDWTRIPYRGKPADQCPDSPRYKALGNSMSTNCVEWILRRIVAAMRLGLIERP